MDQKKSSHKLTMEVINEFMMPKELCYDFIRARFDWEFAIGFDFGRASLNPGKAVVRMDLNGNLLEVYPRLIDAANDVGIDKGGISKVCLGKKKVAAGFKWRFANPNDYYTYRRINTIE